MYKSRRARSGDSTNPDALHWQCKDHQKTANGNGSVVIATLRVARISETEMRAFGHFLASARQQKSPPRNGPMALSWQWRVFCIM